LLNNQSQYTYGNVHFLEYLIESFFINNNIKTAKPAECIYETQNTCEILIRSQGKRQSGKPRGSLEDKIKSS